MLGTRAAFEVAQEPIGNGASACGKRGGRGGRDGRASQARRGVRSCIFAARRVAHSGSVVRLTAERCHRHRITLATASRPDLRQHLFGLREPTRLVLGEDQLSIDDDVEDASRSLQELRLDSEFILDLGRQTGGAGQVVSPYAVADLDLHGGSPVSRLHGSRAGWRNSTHST